MVAQQPKVDAGADSAELGARRVGLGGLSFRCVGREAVAGDVDEVGGDVVAQQAARAELDVREARRVEPAATVFAQIDGRLRSEASLAWAEAGYPFRDLGLLPIRQ